MIAAIVFTTLCAATACALASPTVTVTTPSRWQQTYFVISNWVDPVVPSEAFEAAYQQMVEANFTLIVGGFGAGSSDAIDAQLKAAEKVGIRVAVAGAGGRNNVSWLPQPSDYPALEGYQLWDEPSARTFADVAAWTSAILNARPGMLRFVNLLPNYASSGGLGSPTYGAYVDSFIQEVQPDLLSMDHYPRFDQPYAVDGTNKTRAGYVANLAVLREAGLRYGLPFWNFFAAMPYDDYPDPTEDMMRWQAMTSLAYGAKGVLYFCYWTPIGFPLGGAIITPRGTAAGHQMYQPGPHYAQAARINSVLRQFGNVLIHANSTGVFHVPGNASAEEASAVLQGCLISNASNYAVSDMLAGDGLLLGQFLLPDGRRAVLLTNHNFAFTVWPTLSFAGGIEQAAVQEVVAGVPGQSPVLDDSPLTAGLQLNLQAAQARLLLFDKAG